MKKLWGTRKIAINTILSLIMKQKRVLICTIISFIALFYGCSLFHPKEKQEFRDINGKIYKLVYLNSSAKNAYYLTIKGEKIKICNNPEENAILFNDTISFQDFISKNLNLETGKDVEGKVYIALFIDKKGNIIEKRVLKEIEQCPECTSAALNLVDKLHPIKAAMSNGYYVNSVLIIYIPFGLQK